MTRACVVCGTLFEAKTDRAKYCCKKCANHSRYKRTPEEIRRDNTILSEEIHKLYDIGLNDVQIAEKLSVSQWKIRHGRAVLGLPRQKSKHQRERERLDIWRETFQKERRICKSCGTDFSPIRINQTFCSRKCEKRNNHQRNDIKRRRLENIQKLEDITLDDVFIRYKGVCYLCGGLCDYNAVKIVNGVRRPLGDYPSREHIRPLSKNGLHTWDNIRLAHIRCNSSKGTRYG